MTSVKKPPSKWDLDYMKFCASEGFDPKLRTIELYGEIDDLLAKQFMQNMDRLEDLSKTEPITIKINSVGGYVNDGFAIYDRITMSPCHVTVEGYGNVMSMATIIMQAADERLLAPNTCYMIHYGSAFIHGNTMDTIKWSKYNENVDNPRAERIYLAKIHKKQPKFKLKDLQSMLISDTIMTADEAVELGLADRIITP
jgi:ATP-dependent Clp protease protease subunit